MDKEGQQLPSRTHHAEVSIWRSAWSFFKTRPWFQLSALIFCFGLFYVLFHHYLPTYRDLWYDFRPSEKELVFDSSDQMQFVDEKNGQFLVWYETYPDRYRFFNEPGFYGAGKERDLADTEGKIAMLKQWVDRHAASAKQAHDDLAQNQAVVTDLHSKLTGLEEADKALQDKVSSQDGDISTLVKQNKELAQEVQSLKQAASTPAVVPVAASDATPAPIVENPDYYRHGAVIPPNPKPSAWFQSLTWGKLPPPPYRYNAGNGFFEIPDNPESRIAPHPHLLLKSKKTGLYERPYLFFIKIHGPPPATLQIPPLDDGYYETLKRNFDAVFSFDYPYKVTLGGVDY